MGHLLAVDQSQHSLPANQSEQTGLWFQTEGEKRYTGRIIKSFFNIENALVIIEAQKTYEAEHERNRAPLHLKWLNCL